MFNIGAAELALVGLIFGFVIFAAVVIIYIVLKERRKKD